MTETEYINATDLAKLRAAYGILRDVFPSASVRRIEIMRKLQEWIDETREKMGDVVED